MPTMHTPQTYCPSPHLPISMISSPPIYYTNTLYYLRCMRHCSPSHPPRPPPDHPAHASPNPLRLPQTPCLATSYPPYPPPACSPPLHMLTQPNPTPSPCHVLSRIHLATLKELQQLHQLSAPLTPTQGLVYSASATKNHHMPK